MILRRAVLLAPGLAALMAGCAARSHEARPRPPAPGWSQAGIASWYGPTFHGRPTASGEPYNMLALSAAHRSLPMGSWIRVQELAGGRRLVVRVNDRGPFVRGRIVDLSYAAAKILGLPAAGTAKVRITLLAPAEGKRIAARQAAVVKRVGLAAWGEAEFAHVEGEKRYPGSNRDR